jgi:hypothetical protein
MSPSQAPRREFAGIDVPLRWQPDGTLRDSGGRSYVTFRPPAPPPPPKPVNVPVLVQAVDAVALTSVITGLLVVLRVALRF